MLWEQLQAPWRWLFEQLANPGVLRPLLVLVAGTVVLGFLTSKLIHWLMQRHLADATNHLLDKYDRRYRFHGIPRAPLVLIAECTAWVFALKLISELLQPFVVRFIMPGVSDEILGVARYDWLVLSSLAVLIVLFWMRFHRKVRDHDATKPDIKGIRTRWRTIPLFARPTLALLLLMFLPDVCRFAATLGADWARATLTSFAQAEASANGPLLGRNFAGDLRVTVRIEPKERVAADVGK